MISVVVADFDYCYNIQVYMLAVVGRRLKQKMTSIFFSRFTYKNVAFTTAVNYALRGRRRFSLDLSLAQHVVSHAIPTVW